jgi:hypothetical protein
MLLLLHFPHLLKPLHACVFCDLVFLDIWSKKEITNGLKHITGGSIWVVS